MASIKLLPAEFAMLESIAGKYAKSDDVERALRVETASQHDLETLVTAVSPLFDKINAYLDENTDERACNLGDLAQAACEAQIILAQRQ